MYSSGAKRLVALAVLGGVLPSILADESPVTNDSPYRVIITRNAFDIKPPEPPPVIAPPAPPPPPPSNIFITGLMNVGGPKRVFFAVNRPGQPVEYIDLEEGMIHNEITVLSIDTKTESVRIRNGGNESTLTIRSNSLLSAKGGIPGALPQLGQPPGGIPGAAPGVPPPPGNAPGVRSGAQVAPNVGGPVIVGKRGDVQQINLPDPGFNNNAGANFPTGGGDFVQQPVSGIGGATMQLPTRRAKIESSPTVGIDPSTGAPVAEGARPTLPPNFIPPLPRSP